MVEKLNMRRVFTRLFFLLLIVAAVFFISQCRGTKVTADVKTYRDNQQRFEIKYPAKLISISRDDNRTKLLHSIPFEHPNPCEFDDTADPPLAELIDFNVSIEVLDKNLKGAVILYEASAAEYFLASFISDNMLKIEPGHIDTVGIGSLKGYRISQGVEGCGQFTYYFALHSEITLIVTRAYITELGPIIRNYEENRKLPGIIVPDKEERLFNQILSTFKFLK